LSLIEANAPDLGTGALRRDLDARVALYREGAVAILGKLQKARVTRVGAGVGVGCGCGCVKHTQC